MAQHGQIALSPRKDELNPYVLTYLILGDIRNRYSIFSTLINSKGLHKDFLVGGYFFGLCNATFISTLSSHFLQA